MAKHKPSTETWKPVVGYEDYYEVSDNGRVRSLDRVVPHKTSGTLQLKGRVLRGTTKPHGHIFVGLSVGGKVTDRYVHGLVLTAFVGPRPSGMECCHWDGNPANNHLDNLRWDDRSGNIMDMVRAGTHNHASKTHCKNGHEFTPENTRLYGPRNNWRRCIACKQSHGRMTLP